VRWLKQVLCRHRDLETIYKKDVGMDEYRLLMQSCMKCRKVLEDNREKVKR
jgi:hypothetical protein